MRPRRIVFAGAALAGLAGVAALAQQRTGEAGEAPAEGLTVLGEPMTAEQIELGRHLYGANCASCHGADLEGQADWKRRLPNGRMPAPPHDETGHTWHHSDEDLFTVTKRGVGAIVPGYESDMPAFEGILSDTEIAATLAYIKSTWPEHQREFQARITAKDEGGS
ncbi:cytochrome c [Acuticoccus sp. I52.16.1]|uniref:c-type cytochrome n=1 Tax=Acuticoccus sp. I52.16.1 TaxID=2928472 RepID=UPI001FD1FB78|nr:cytochrome c [Acuticoccus sp. I52.16.1]UOM37026.1 cytochrome c [Acuticoccus sp. I52.16.1]